MSDNVQNVPRIRFPGFSDAWEQRKLSDEFADFIVPMRDKPKEFGGSIPWTRIEDIEGKYLNGTLSGQYVSEETVKKMNLKIIPKDSLIVSSSATFGVVAVVTQDLITNQTFIGLVPNDKDTIDYWYSYFQSNAARRYMKLQSAGSTIFYISRESFENMPITLPSKEEAIKIGECLAKIDETITLHQRKCDDLKTLKQGMLQKMFPKDGDDIPEIRFPEFTDAWEQRKVSEITEFHKQGFYTTEEYGENKKYYLLRGTDLTQNKLVLKDTPKIDATEKDYQAFKIQIGDFLIVRSGTVGTYGIVYDDIPAIFGSYLIDFRFDKSMVTNEFFGYFYQSDSFKNQLRQIIQQSANTNINAENIKSTHIMLPSLEEQKRIGEFLEVLDNTITLHQRKCEELKEIKKALLQQMFV